MWRCQSASTAGCAELWLPRTCTASTTRRASLRPTRTLAVQSPAGTVSGGPPVPSRCWDRWAWTPVGAATGARSIAVSSYACLFGAVLAALPLQARVRRVRRRQTLSEDTGATDWPGGPATRGRRRPLSLGRRASASGDRSCLWALLPSLSFCRVRCSRQLAGPLRTEAPYRCRDTFTLGIDNRRHI